ncbi:MAG: hypothetical protein WC532_02360 [Candidatus Omnitrophota bacterium]
MLTLAVLIIGFSGLLAQTVLLRELLVSYLGNELTLGIILSGWLTGEALGVFTISRIIDRVAAKAGVFALLQIIFSIAFPASVYLARTFKSITGLAAGEATGLPLIFYSAFLVMLPAAFCHAGLFSCGCKLFSLAQEQTQEAKAASIAKIYALEITGTIIAGFMLTYVLLSRYDSFQIAFMAAAASLLVNIPFLNLPRLKILKYLNFSLAGVFIYLIISGSSAYFQKASVDKQFSSGKVIDYRNSVYGNTAVVKNEGQYTFFYNGVPSVVAPLPDITFSEEFGNLPLLFHPEPKKILIIGAGSGGLINEILKYSAETIDYVELDPLFIAALKRISISPLKEELTNARVNIVIADGRAFLRRQHSGYDVILVGLSSPRDLSTNRFFTADFFALAAERLNPGGILSFCLPGSLTYLSSELKNINACIFNAAKMSFPYVRIIPGDYNIFLTSTSPAIMETGAGQLSGRLASLNVKTNLLVPAHIEYRLNRRWADWFNRSMAGATTKINRDTRPIAVFESLILWNKQFSSAVAAGLIRLSRINLKISLSFVILAAYLFFLLIFFRRKKRQSLSAAFSIATTGFFGMLISLVIIFLFQIRYGSIYREIGILTSLFMAGSAIGSIISLRLLAKKQDDHAADLLIRVEARIILFITTVILLAGFLRYSHFAYPAFLIISFIAGMLVGMEFPIAGRIYISKGKPVGETSGGLYFVDLAGGCLAGVLGGVLLLPVIGIEGTCLTLAVLKLSSLSMLIFAKIPQKKL